MSRRYQHTAWAMAVLFMLALASPSLAQTTELDGTRIDRSTWSTFQGNYRKYARFAFEYNGGYGIIPNYRRSVDSSLGMTVDEVLDEYSEEREIRTGNLVRKVRRTPPREDALAYARALPDMNFGSYGYVASVEILHIINDNEMIVSKLWLVDREALSAEYAREKELNIKRNNGELNRDELNFQYVSRIKLREKQDSSKDGMAGVFRLVGFNTRGLRVGQRWKGLRGEGFQVGVAGWERPTKDEFAELDRATQRAIGRRDRIVLTELTETLKRGLDQENFKKLLQDRGMTVTEFVEVVRRIRKERAREADELIFEALLPTIEDE